MTPRWIALTAFAVLLLVAFVLLGQWQWHRTFQAPDGWSDEPAAVALTSLDPIGEALPGASVARQVLVTGVYEPIRQLLVAGQQLAGQPVFWVLTPLQMPDGSQVEVVRGWINDPHDPLAAPPTGQVQVTGRLRPDDDPASGSVLPAGQVSRVDARALASNLGGSVHDGYLVRIAQSPPDPLSLQPVPTSAPPSHGTPPLQFHLQNFLYTLQWHFFALVVGYMWWRLLRDDARARSHPPQPRPAEAAEVLW